MTPLARAVAWYRAHRGDPDAVRRIRARLTTEAACEEQTDALLRRIVPDAPEAMARVRARVLSPRPRRHAAFPAALVLPAALLLWLLWPTRPPIRLAQELQAQAIREEVLTAALAVAYQGAGAVSGTEGAPRIRWDRGRLSANLTPGRGVALEVDTLEAEVRVVGTTFDVIRDVLGTEVRVQHGHVRVRCLDGSGEHDVRAGGTTACLPVTAGGLLGRAGALTERGAPPDEVLATLDRALAVPESSAILRDELSAMRIMTLVRAGHDAEARSVADAFLAHGTGIRRADVARLAARLALRMEGCSAALRYVDTIAPGERQAADEIARADCLAATAPAEARAALEAALALDPSLEAAIRSRLVRLR